MDLQAFKDGVEAVDWHQFDGPEYYDGAKVAPALVALAEAETEDYSRHYSLMGIPPICMNSVITSDVLFAIGNDHAGAYYPAAFKALAYIADVALRGNTAVARNCAINIMIDLYFFGFDPGCPMRIAELKKNIEVMKAAIASYSPKLMERAQKETDLNRKLIIDFIKDQQERDNRFL